MPTGRRANEVEILAAASRGKNLYFVRPQVADPHLPQRFWTIATSLNFHGAQSG
jgi:hypothetical protein